MREIVLDTETTGLDPAQGHRIVEIGCVELENHIPTGRTFHRYLNPECSISEEVVAVHGLTERFLSDKPKFAEIIDDFLGFIGSDTTLIIHNAAFDLKFLNFELARVRQGFVLVNNVIDTIQLARQKFPGSRVNLNELCRRFGIDLSARNFHGALLDSQLLSEVYLELIGGREPGLTFAAVKQEISLKVAQPIRFEPVQRPPRSFEVSPAELEQHTEFIKKIKNNLWGVS
ncbi:MAG: DNA polymerase III subunit epsilon [Alphaproteobacteria bacterium]|nr:DNA polymerase III subunit epsilon [Alphaproteobacteria bacterium]